MKRVFVDCVTSCKAITSKALAKLGIDQSRIEQTYVDILGVTGDYMRRKGHVTLEIELHDNGQIWRGDLEFTIVDHPPHIT